MDEKKALRESSEAAAIDAAAPTRKRLAEELGPFKTCDVSTYVEEADGTSQVNITSEKATPEENRRRWGVHVEALERKRALEVERSQRREADQEVIRVYDARTNEERPVRPEYEAVVAKKKWARPSRGRKYFSFSGGKAV